MFKYFIVSFYIALLFVGRNAYSLEVNDLYQASVGVDSQSISERRRGLKTAMQAVMLKVGGQLSVLDNNVLKKALKTANTYITQYHYQQVMQQVMQQVNQPKKLSTEKQLNLVVSFNEDKINKLFYQANLSIWGRLRPQLLLWLIDEHGLQRSIISNSTTAHSIKPNTSNINFPNVVSDFSYQRGLPVLMPLMDFDDASQIMLSDLWGRFEQPIRYASARYSPEAIVVIRISNSSLVPLAESTELGNTTNNHDIDNNQELVNTNRLKSNCGLLCVEDKVQYALDWTLLSPQVITSGQSINQQQIFSQQYQGTDKKLLLQQGLADVTEIIYQHYALSTEVNNKVVIEVANIESLTAYAQLFDFLTDLSAIKSVTLVSAKGSARRFDLELLGSKSALLASLKLNKKLQQYIDPLAQVDESAIPIFYWEQR